MTRLHLLLGAAPVLLLAGCYSTLPVASCDEDHDHDHEVVVIVTDDDDDTAGDDDDTPSEAADDDDATDPADDGDDDDDDEPPPSSDCDADGFDIVIHQATQFEDDPTQPMFLYQARSTDQVPFDEIQLFSFQGAPYWGPSTPGSYSLSGMNYADCSLCLLLVEGCSEEYSCDTVYFADAGTVQIDAIAGAWGTFAATLVGVELREVDIDPATYESTPVPGGDTWCVDDLSVEVTTNPG